MKIRSRRLRGGVPMDGLSDLDRKRLEQFLASCPGSRRPRPADPPAAPAPKRGRRA